jgi:hypothetical protein
MYIQARPRELMISEHAPPSNWSGIGLRPERRRRPGPGKPSSARPWLRSLQIIKNGGAGTINGLPSTCTRATLGEVNDGARPPPPAVSRAPRSRRTLERFTPLAPSTYRLDRLCVRFAAGARCRNHWLFEQLGAGWARSRLGREPSVSATVTRLLFASDNSEARAHDATRHASSGHGRCREGAVRRVTECDCLRGRPVSSMKGRVLSRSRYGIVKCECVFGMLDRDGARDGWGFGALPWIGCVVAGRAWPGQAVCVAGGGGRRRLVALDAGG